MDTLKNLLSLESKLKIDSSLLDRMLEKGQEIKLAPHQAMIDEGETNPNIYIVKSGVIRGTKLSQNVEVTSGFALPGTIIMSFHCYYGGEPSFYRFEACTRSVVIKIPKAHFDALIEDSHEFARWILNVHQHQLYYYELKNKLLSRTPRERLATLFEMLSSAVADPFDCESLPSTHEANVKNMYYARWRRILSYIPSRAIASYIGITEQHFSKIKRELLSSSSPTDSTHKKR